MDFLGLFKNCRLCPRGCGVNRLGEGKGAHSGFCRESHQLRVAYVGPHFGEEPPITGKNGSGAIFFAGCSLQCAFCQNHQISRDGIGAAMDLEALVERVRRLIKEKGVHNINLVTPDHFFPYTFRLVSVLDLKGQNVPVVYNLSGYQSPEMLRLAEDYADIYLPDFKYADPGLSRRLSRCKDYPGVALEAISEMVRQKGFLSTSENLTGIGKKGVLVRHLILPGHIENSLDALTTLFLEFGPRLPISLMSQYQPVLPLGDPDLNRALTPAEFHRVYAHALGLGFQELFVQFPAHSPRSGPKLVPFLPDFRRDEPFSGQSARN